MGWSPPAHRATLVGFKQVGLPFGGVLGAGAVAWLSGRTSLFGTLFAVLSTLAFTRTMFRDKLIGEQMAADGGFPRELGRTKPYGYSLFQLDIMGMLAEILSTPRESAWAFSAPDGRGMRKALEFMYPFIRDKSSWPRARDVMYHDAWPVRHPVLLFGGLALGESRYVELWKTLNPDPVVDEVIRNYPIRQPLLWMRQR